VFRGFLWPQLSARLGGGRCGAWLGALLSQAAFAALHVPILLHNGVAPGELAGPLLGLFLSGLVLLTVYAATGNLFIAVGIHALGNAPTLLFQPQGLPPSVWLLGGTLVLIALAWWWRRKNETRLAAGSMAMAPD
jgi:membrane protease YdiL (CAAX protease family)